MGRPASAKNLVPEITSAVLRRAFSNPPKPGRSYYVQERGSTRSIPGCAIRVLRTEVQFGVRAGDTWHKVVRAYPDMTPEEIQKARVDVRKKVRQIEDGEVPTPEARGMTFRELRDAYLEDWRSGRGENRSPRTEEGYRDLWDRLLLPFRLSSGKILGDMPVREITPRMVQEVKVGLPGMVAARSRVAKSGGQTVTNRALQQGSAAFCFALRMREADSNPFSEEIVTRHAEGSDGYSFELGELAKIGEALDYYETLSHRPRSPLAFRSVAGLRLLLLTGARPSEITDAYLEKRFLPEGSLEPYALLDDPYPRVYVQRAKGDRGNQKRAPGRFIWLAPRAVEIIRRVPRVPGDIFVLPGDAPGDHLQRLNSAWTTVIRAAGVTKAPLKSTRHTFRTWAPQAGVPPESVQQLLGHAGLKITDTVYLHAIAPALEAWAHRVAEFMHARLKGEAWKPGAAWSPPEIEADGAELRGRDVN